MYKFTKSSFCEEYSRCATVTLIIDQFPYKKAMAKTRGKWTGALIRYRCCTGSKASINVDTYFTKLLKNKPCHYIGMRLNMLL